MRTMLAFVAVLLTLAPGNALWSQQPLGNVPARPLPPERASLIRKHVNVLNNELEYLLEGLAVEGLETRTQYEQIDALLKDLGLFREMLGSGIDGSKVYRQFQTVDQKIHKLQESLQDVKEAPLARAVARVRYADHQLHYAMSLGTNEIPSRAVITRQALALETESRELEQAARYVLARRPEDRRLFLAIADFAREAEHFDQMVRKDASPAHLRKDFQKLTQHWKDLVSKSSETLRSTYLTRRIERVNSIYSHLDQLLTTPKSGKTP